MTPRTGVLAVNLGTPAAPTRRAVARYLREFLADPRVVDLPRWLWLPLLYGVIVPLRAPRSAEAYRKIWGDDGSPLLTGSQALVDALDTALGDEAHCVLAMRYGAPSIRAGLDQLRAAGCQELMILPLYPQYSRTTSESVFDGVSTALAEMKWSPPRTDVRDYHDQPEWLDAVADSIRAFRAEHGEAERLMFSLHGIPARYDTAGDPYAGQCCSSTVAIAERLGMEQPAWYLAFQSRVGREPWLQPYTDQTLEAWAREGIRHVQVVCPGFAVDCIETLEEIAMENRDDFIAAGGERLDYIPCLNDAPQHVNALVAVIRSHALA